MTVTTSTPERGADQLSSGHPDGGGRATAAIGRAILAVLALVAITVGVPALLVALGSALPVDLSALSPRGLTRPDDGSLVLLLLLVVAWGAWAVMVASVGIEVWAALRRVPSPRLPGLGAPQRVAAALVALVAVTLLPTASSTAAPLGRETGPATSLSTLVSTSTSVPVELSAMRTVDRTSQAASVEKEKPAAAALPRVVTRRHDTLWSLAERHLGSGERFAEIAALNEGLPQRDGRTLGPDGRLYPGWTLTLPADATMQVPESQHLVEPGDTLWEIAAEELGDGTRYPEIFEANEGDRQPDGRRLRDPDLILPGWILEVPGVEESAAIDRSSTPAAPDPDGGARHQRSGEATGRDATGDPAKGHTSPRAQSPSAAASDAATAESPEVAGSAPSIERSSGSRAPESDGPRTDDPRSGESEAGDDPAGDIRAQGSATDRDSAQGRSAGGEARPSARPATTGTSPSATEPSSIDRGGAAVDSAAHEAGHKRADDADDAAAAAPEPGEDDVEDAASAAPDSAVDDAEDAASAAPEPSAAPADPALVIDRAALIPDSAIPMPAGGLLGVLVLAGLAGELARRRRQFQRHRRPGERMPIPGEEAREIEVAARTAAGEATPELLERAVGQLARSCRSSGTDAPPVRLVRLTPDSVFLHLSESSAPALAPFRVAGDRLWELDRALLDSADEDGEGLPALVTLGMRQDETLLLNLAEVGTLQVGGASEALPGVLRAFASELALGPAGNGAARTLALSDHALSEAIRSAMEAGDLAVESDQERLGRTLAAAMSRGPQDPWLGDPLELVLTDRPLPLTVPGRCGAALITTHPSAAAGASLVLAADGTATLEPEGLMLTPQTLAAGASDRLVELLRTTEVPLTLDVPAWASAPAAEHSRPDPRTTRAAHRDREGVAASRGPILAPVPVANPTPRTLEDAAERTGDVPSSAPRLLLLGEPQVENAHGKAESTRIGRLAETAAFVLLNPGARPSELQAALWPGRRSNPQTCRQMISRTRTWLGRTDAGETYLMQLAESDGRLRLRAEVGSDWSDFQRLAAAGLADPEDTAALSQALQLVRGRPFGSIAARELPWADLFINEMICQITDVAHELALRYERSGRWSAAREAALRGLRTECESEVLEGVVARLGRSA